MTHITPTLTMYFRDAVSTCTLFCFLFVIAGCDHQFSGMFPKTVESPALMPGTEEVTPQALEPVVMVPITDEVAPQAMLPTVVNLDTHYEQILRERLEPSPPVPRIAVAAPQGLASVTADLDTYYEQILRERLELQEKMFKAMILYREISQRCLEQEMQIKRYLKGQSVSETIDFFRRSRPNEIPLDLQIAYSLWRDFTMDDATLLQIDTWIKGKLNGSIFEDYDAEIREMEHKQQMGTFVDSEELVRLTELRVRTQQMLYENPTDATNRRLFEEESIENQKIRWAD